MANYLPESGVLTLDLMARMQKILVQDSAPSGTIVNGFVCYIYATDPITKEKTIYSLSGGMRPNDEIVSRGLDLLSGE